MKKRVVIILSSAIAGVAFLAVNHFLLEKEAQLIDLNIEAMCQQTQIGETTSSTDNDDVCYSQFDFSGPGWGLACPKGSTKDDLCPNVETNGVRPEYTHHPCKKK